MSTLLMLTSEDDTFTPSGDFSFHTVFGLEGNDVITLTGSIINLFAGDGADTVTLTGNNNRLSGDDGDDSLTVNGNSNVVFGGTGNDSISAYGNNNVIFGGEDSKNIYVYGNDNSVYGAEGTSAVHYITAIGHRNLLVGGEGIAYFEISAPDGPSEDNLIVAADAQANVEGNVFRSTFIGNEFDDYVYFTGDSNLVSGGEGDDTLIVDGSRNNVYGNEGSDIINAFGTRNRVFGGEGNDLIFADGGLGHRLDGGEGSDIINAFTNNSTLLGRADDDFIFVSGNLNKLEGGTGFDHIIAFGDDNIILGNAGNDYVAVTGNNNVLRGNVGDDILVVNSDDYEIMSASSMTGNVLIGGTGIDRLIDQAVGAETVFRWEALNESSRGIANADVVIGFTPGEDKLDLAALGPGLSFIGTAPFSGVAGQIRAVASGSDTLIRLDADGNGTPDFTIVLANVSPTSLSVGDFILS